MRKIIAVMTAVFLLFSNTVLVSAGTGPYYSAPEDIYGSVDGPGDLYRPGTVHYGTAILSAANRSYCLNAENGSVKNHTNAQLYQYDRTYGCSFVLSCPYERNARNSKEIIDGDYYEIILTKSASSRTGLKCLSVADGSICNARNVELKKRDGSFRQLWQVKINSDGTVTLLCAQNKNYALDLRSCKTANKQNIQVYRVNGTKAQKWILKDLKETDLGDYRADYKEGMETFTQKKGSSKRYEMMPLDCRYHEFRFYSSNPSVAAVDSATGIVTAKAKGTAIITVEIDGIARKTAKLRVRVP